MTERKTRWMPRFGIAWLLLLMLIVGVPLAWLSQVQRQEKLIARITAAGGGVAFVEEDSEQPAWRRWLQAWLGEKHTRQIRSITLYETDARELLPQMTRYGSITHLELGECELTDASLRTIANLRQLEVLSLAGNRELGDQGAAELAKLSQLKYLDISITSIGDDGVAALRDLSELRILKLYGTQVTDGGMESVAAMSTLSDLDIGNTLVSNQGLKPLAQLPQLYRLRLDQMSTGSGEELRIDDQGMDHVEQMPALGELCIVNFPISSQRLARLQQQNPKLSVHR